MQVGLSGKIAIFMDKIVIFEPKPSSSYHVLLSQPQFHRCRKVDDSTYLFDPIDDQHLEQAVCILQLDKINSIIQKRQAWIVTLPQNQQKSSFINSSKIKNSSLIKSCSSISENPEKEKILYITKYQYNLASYQEETTQLQELEPEDISVIMEKMKKFGQFSKMDTVGPALVLTFPASSFKCKPLSWFLLPNCLKQYKKKFRYCAITQVKPILRIRTKILKMPKTEQFRQIIFHGGWIIARTKSTALFIRDKRPFAASKFIQLQGITGFITFFADKIILTAYKYLHIYNLDAENESVELLSVVKLKGLQPFCFSTYGQHCLFGGLNHTKTLLTQSHITENRTIYVVQNFQQFNFKSKTVITPDRKIEICNKVPLNCPVEMIHGNKKLNLLVCCVDKTFYVVHMDKEIGRLAQLVLDSSFKLVRFIPYPFNIGNYIGITKCSNKEKNQQNNGSAYGHILRVGMDVYMEQYGLELKSYSLLPKARSLALANQANYTIYVLDQSGKGISIWNILKQKMSLNVTRVLQGQTIQLIASSKRFLTYIVENEHYYDFHHIQSYE